MKKAERDARKAAQKAIDAKIRGEAPPEASEEGDDVRAAAARAAADGAERASGERASNGSDEGGEGSGGAGAGGATKTLDAGKVGAGAWRELRPASPDLRVICRLSGESQGGGECQEGRRPRSP